MSYVPLDPLDLALAALLILVNAAVSLAFRLGLERTLVIVSVRMVVQLALIGLVLKWIFAQTSPLWTFALAAVMTATAYRERAAIEARLALGAPRFEALSDPIRRALRTGMMPIINAMAASGVVSLPGMMTGQILAGGDPVEATKYQILIMFLLAGTTALGVVMAVLGGVLLITDERHRLRLDRLTGGRAADTSARG